MIRFTAAEGRAVRTFTQGVTDRVTDRVNEKVTDRTLDSKKHRRKSALKIQED